MNKYIETIQKILTDLKGQAGLSMVAAIAATASPEVAATIVAFKEISSVADSIRGDYIIKGLSTGLNVEKFTNELASFVSKSEKNAFYISSTLRKAMLADSTIVCALMGRIMADHVRDNRPYDRSDVIIVKALESATDDDIIMFRCIMQKGNGNRYIENLKEYREYIDWGLSTRIFAQENSRYEADTLIMGSRIVVTESAYRLLDYTTEIKQLFRNIR